MAYSSNYYNYQIGVIFAILIGGLLLILLVVAAIYFLCVRTMRTEKQKMSTSGPPPRRVEYGQPPYSSLNNQPVQQPIDYSYNTRPAYNQSTLVQPYNNQNIPEDSRIRNLQPEFAYQQGPMTWATMSPVHEAPYPMSPAPASQAAFHTSSV